MATKSKRTLAIKAMVDRNNRCELVFWPFRISTTSSIGTRISPNLSASPSRLAALGVFAYFLIPIHLGTYYPGAALILALFGPWRQSAINALPNSLLN